MKYVPNILTVLRIICASLLLVTPVYSCAFDLPPIYGPGAMLVNPGFQAAIGTTV